MGNCSRCIAGKEEPYERLNNEGTQPSNIADSNEEQPATAAEKCSIDGHCERSQGAQPLLEPTSVSLSAKHRRVIETPVVKVVVPVGAVDDSTETTLTVSVVMTTGSAASSYPADVLQISPILLMQSSEPVTLRKPIEITIPHTLQQGTTTADVQRHIGLLRANQEDTSGLRFVKVPECMVTLGTDENEGCATFQSQHIGLLQLYADEHIRERAEKATCCLCRFDPREITAVTLKYHYVLTYYMKQFLEAIKREFPDHIKQRVLPCKFEKPLKKFSARFNHSEMENWIVTFTGNDERWGQTKEEIELDIENGIYPPRLTLQACPKYQSVDCGSATVSVAFRGLCKPDVESGRKEQIVDNLVLVQGDPPERKVTQPHSVQSQALLNHHNKICSFVAHNIMPFADVLVSHDLIRYQLKQRAADNTGLSNQEKAGELMNAVYTQVQSDSNKFETFLSALREIEHTANLVETLEKASRTASISRELSFRKASFSRPQQEPGLN